MYAAAVIAYVHAIQQAYLVLSTLQLTAYNFPTSATVKDCAVYDFIVVGGGSAGCVVANRLSEDGENSVLLIEAGGDPPVEVLTPGEVIFTKNTRYDWNYTNTKDPYISQYNKNQVIDLTRGKVLGGSSGMNYMLYVRGSPHDFDTWADIVGDKSWEYENVLPLFKKSERLDDAEIKRSRYGPYHGYSGGLGTSRQLDDGIKNLYLPAFHEVGNKIVLDTSTGELGYTQPLYTVDNGIRQITSYAFLTPIKNRTNLHVWKNTLATKIIFDSSKNAVAVETLTSDDIKITVKAKKEIVVSAGAINAPQLLMLSGIGPKEHLEELEIPVISDLPVGKNFVDHLCVLLSFKMGKLPPSQPPVDPHKPPVTFLGYVAENKSQSFPDYQAASFVIRDSDAVLGGCAFINGFDNSVCQSLYESTKGHEVLSTNLVLLHPKSSGEVLLKSRDPKEHPLINAGYLSDPDDLERFVDYIEDYIKVLGSSYFEDVNAEFVRLNFPSCNAIEDRREYLKCFARNALTTLYHYAGSCAMGTVVDSKLRVKGVQGLRVADASVMPYITSGNTNAPTIMIGEKVSAMIINSMKSSKNNK